MALGITEMKMFLRSRYAEFNNESHMRWEHEACDASHVAVDETCEFCGEDTRDDEPHECALSEVPVGYDLSSLEWFGAA